RLGLRGHSGAVRAAATGDGRPPEPRRADPVRTHGRSAGHPRGRRTRPPRRPPERRLRRTPARRITSGGLTRLAAGPPQGKTAPLGGAASRRSLRSVGGNIAAGPPQGKTAPLGGAA